jgi:DNA polymerase III alpha subunit
MMAQTILLFLRTLAKMIKDKFSQLIFNEDDLMDIVMRGDQLSTTRNTIVDQSVDISSARDLLNNLPLLTTPKNDNLTVEQWDKQNQSNWHMPENYKSLDIAEYVLSLCDGDAELQRVGEELLLYQERGLFDLLRYLKYLVDTMRENNIIWGVGRGSSVASFVLYKMGVHRINSLYYSLDIKEFLR